MKVLMVTPLYPPDVAPLAGYIKELAKRLSRDHEVTIIAYAHIPETIPGVQILAIPKHTLLPIRLISFLSALWKVARGTDLLFVQNGASVELPMCVLRFVIRTPIVFYISDPTPIALIKKYPALFMLHGIILGGARHIIVSVPYHCPQKYLSKTTFLKAPHIRPEILPFQEYPEKAFKDFAETWDAHIKELLVIFHHVKQ